MRRLVHLVLLLVTACGGGLSKSQVGECNGGLDDMRDFTAQLQTYVSDGDRSVTGAMGDDVRDVRAQADKAHGDIAAALNDVASEMSGLQLDLASVDKEGATDGLVSAAQRLRDACKTS